MNFEAQQVAPQAPIWNLLADGVDVGLLTRFPGEGLVFTVRHGDAKVTDYSAATMHEAIETAKQTYKELVDGTHFPPEEDYIEDEDGEIARMRHEENEAERFYQYHHGDDPY